MAEEKKLTKEEQKQKEYNAALALFQGMNQEEANAYITKTYTKVQMTKALIVAYINTYGTSEADKTWKEEEFKVKTMVEEIRTELTVCTDNKGNAIHKLNKDGKAIAKTARVQRMDGATKKVFKINIARDMFATHFNITYKAGNFNAKAKRTTKVWDALDEL